MHQSLLLLANSMCRHSQKEATISETNWKSYRWSTILLNLSFALQETQLNLCIFPVRTNLFSILIIIATPLSFT